MFSNMELYDSMVCAAKRPLSSGIIHELGLAALTGTYELLNMWSRSHKFPSC